MLTSSVESIQMVDLKNQYLKIKPAIDEAIQECVNSAAFIKGPQVSAFEQQLGHYLTIGNVVACANGTDALQVAMMALNLQPGDEVIVPSFTYVATAEVIALLRLQPVMVDVDPKTFTICPSAIEQAISQKTKAVVPVHLFGQCADMERISDLCSAYDLFVIEDAAQAIGATYSYTNGNTVSAGAMGTLGTTSFFPSKNLGCFGDGGAVFTNNDTIASHVRMIANHGQAKKYEHDAIGINSRLDSIQAAILLEKLKFLSTYTLYRQQVADMYDAVFSGITAIEIPYRMLGSTHVFNQYTLKVPAAERDELKAYLDDRKIPSMIYYPMPLHKQKAYQGLGRVVGELSVTEELCKQVISLPIHTELSNEQIQYITESVTTYFN
ncbi:DegT/DnrJ/EryC1/StrS family aminotransferase [Spirosoma oryzicola]|uniref:DegT/DnrJ/EryC1/StrS family aminotransferase n=1 Tax=Spirosoma oryzicola TaxID=2898794 RepID=UPI001E5C91FE|nr:DegT/DnrJ/EryC1/StrS family aminotransferase [Spirosoma oryzicola]UHG94051.1 DegT/DnrJ/EryC1/StrS family aminotransferase [Spirosoma oryzicola]